MSRSHAHARRVRPEEFLRFQIPAHLAERGRGRLATESRGRVPELAAEGVGEMAVARETEIEGDVDQPSPAVGQALQRRPQAQPVGQFSSFRMAPALRTRLVPPSNHDQGNR